MATTTLKLITDALQAIINVVTMTDGSAWSRVSGLDRPENLSTVDHDKHYFIDQSPGEEIDPDFGYDAVQTIRARVDVLLFRDLNGADSEDAMIVFQDDARKVSAAINKSSAFPAGVNMVLAGQIQAFTDKNENDGTLWARAVVPVTLIFDADY